MRTNKLICIPDESGNIEQVTHYYPYGMSFAEGRGKNIQPYKFNGKELDAEDGLNWMDYGARMYDGALARWNGEDALAEKYNSVTTYGYCSGNPVNYIDPCGNDTIMVNGTDGEQCKIWGVMQENNQYVIESNYKDSNNSIFPKGISNAIHKLYNNEVGKLVLRSIFFNGKNDILSIFENDNINKDISVPYENSIYVSFGKNSNIDESFLDVFLIHEFVHHIDYDLNPIWVSRQDYGTEQGLINLEKPTIHIENLYRTSIGLGLRKSHSGPNNNSIIDFIVGNKSLYYTGLNRKGKHGGYLYKKEENFSRININKILR